MSFKIIKFDQNTGIATVRFNDTSAPVAIVIPVENSQFITGPSLELYIMGFKPVDIITTDVSSIENISDIISMVQEDTIIPPSEVEMASSIRKRRDNLLLLTDFTQLPDSPLSPEIKEQYVQYRQLLRDITEQQTFPLSVEWPTKPVEFVTPVVTVTG